MQAMLIIIKFDTRKLLQTKQVAAECVCVCVCFRSNRASQRDQKHLINMWQTWEINYYLVRIQWISSFFFGQQLSFIRKSIRNSHSFSSARKHSKQTTVSYFIQIISSLYTGDGVCGSFYCFFFLISLIIIIYKLKIKKKKKHIFSLCACLRQLSTYW